MLALHAKDYYVSPIYPVLFAAGGIAWETRFAGSRGVQAGRAFAFPLYETAVLVLAIPFLPLSLPLMRPGEWVRYTKATHLDRVNGNTENTSSGPLPQFYADRFGWQEEVDQVTRIYNALPPDKRRATGLLCTNYGEASAINFLGRGLPVAISGHNNYWLWGTHGYTFDSMILIEETTPAHLHLFFNSVQAVGQMASPWSMPYERRATIYLVQGRRFNLDDLWPKKKDYI